MPLRQCSKPLCKQLIDYSEKYCTKHKGYGDKQYNEEIRYNTDNKQYADFYNSKQWRTLRQSFISAFPLCKRCLEAGHVTQAQIIHHKVEVRHDWNKRLDWDNLESICRSCHNQLHAK